MKSASTMLLQSLLICLVLASIARSDDDLAAPVHFPVHSSDSNISVPNISAAAASALSRQLSEISASHHSNHHHKVKKSVPNQPLNLTTVSESTDGKTLVTGDSAVLKSLKSLISSGKKKQPGINPGIVYQSHHERVNEEIFDDLTKFEGYSKLLSQLMHSIVNKDLGLSAMQQTVDKLAVEASSIKFESILEGITDKILGKIDDAHTILEITGERIQELFKQQLVSNLTSSYLSCCDFFTSELVKKSAATNSLYASEHDLKIMNNGGGGAFKSSKEQDMKSVKYQFDGHFNQWINKHYACDIENDFGRPHFFSPSGPNLTAQFQANLVQFPNVKWQYFMSFMGVHTEYPSYLPPNNYCFLHTINNEQIALKALAAEASGGYPKRGFKGTKSKKHEPKFSHRKAYTELNQLFVQRHRENLFTSALPQSKLVVIVIDRGSALTDHQLNIAKSVAKYILNSLSHRDRVAIVDLTSEAVHPSTEICFSKLELAYANYETKHMYGRYIEEMQRSHNSTNHHLGFQRAFEIISANYQLMKTEGKGEPEIFIPYISRGLLASLADAKPVMELISKELQNCSYSFVINCYALIDETKPIMYETTFLREVAMMNFKKFSVEMPPSNKIRPGLMVALNNTENLSFLLNGIYTVLNKPQAEAYNDVYISLPHYDFISKDTHISLSKAFFFRDRFLGIAGVDLSFADFAEDILHYDHSAGNSYAFLVETHSGRLLYHPAFSRHSRTNSYSYKLMNRAKYSSSSSGGSGYADHYYNMQNSFTNAEHVEQAADFPLVKKAILTLGSGSQTIQLSLHSAAYNESYYHFWYDLHHRSAKRQFTTVTYHWRRVATSSFVVVIAEYGTDQCSHGALNCGLHQKSQINYTLSSDAKLNIGKLLISHRLDYLSRGYLRDVTLCKHFNQLATKDIATLFLTPSAFENPYQLEQNPDSLEIVQQYMHYLTGNKEAENPGLKSGLKGDVNLMATMTALWRELLESSETSKYIVRKYLATTSGAFMVYPGSMLDQSYEPKNRPWYSKAIASPGKLIFTPPYLDVGGAGYIVTLSQTVQTGKRKQSSSEEEDTVWAVMSIDLTLGYFHKIIDEMVPLCASGSGGKSSCFIMDDYGYLIVHSSFLRPSLSSAFSERQHITHKEPQMVNDLLNQRGIVRKFVCNSYNDRTIQRYYMFNASLQGILTNVVQLEDGASSCAKYKMVTLDGTNAFFGIVNHTCDNSTTFCPCSLTDRLCLNCHRMEQTDCECPCDCPLIMDMCSGDLMEKEDKNPSCIPMAEPLREPSLPKYLFDSLDSCVNSECFNKLSESECKGVVACEWCSIDQGHKLKKPFCANQNICFGGTFGSKNPFLANHVFSYPEERRPEYSAPFGPLTTIIVVAFVAFVCAIFCYQVGSTRNFGANYSNHAEHQILQQSMGNEADHHNHDSEFHSNEGNLEAVVSLVRAQVNPNFENIASPYQVNTNYRRPRVESDYGYSTMTPNEADSDLNGGHSIYVDTPLIKSAKLNKLDLLNISASPTVGTASVTSNDNMSTLSSPSSTSSSVAASSVSRLPPPPSKLASKIRSKQRYCFDQSGTKVDRSKHGSGTPLQPVKEAAVCSDLLLNESTATAAEVRLVK